MFCQWARKIGIKIWLCPWMQVGHYGTYLFNGDLKTFALTGDSSHSLDKGRNERQKQLRDTRNQNNGLTPPPQQEIAPFIVDPSKIPGPPEKPVSVPAKKRGRNSKGKNKARK